MHIWSLLADLACLNAKRNDGRGGPCPDDYDQNPGLPTLCLARRFVCCRHGSHDHLYGKIPVQNRASTTPNSPPNLVVFGLYLCAASNVSPRCLADLDWSLVHPSSSLRFTLHRRTCVAFPHHFMALPGYWLENHPNSNQILGQPRRACSVRSRLAFPLSGCAYARGTAVYMVAPRTSSGPCCSL